MITNISYENENMFPYHPAFCAVKEVERLKQQPTIARLLIELQIILEKEQKENPNVEATKEFKKNLDILGIAYKEDIPRIVENYHKEYQNFVREKLPKVEDQYKKLVNWTDDIDNPGSGLRKAIKELREKSYEQVESVLKTQWEHSKTEFKNVHCCRDQVQLLKNKAEQNFEYYKTFKEKVANWFKELDDIYKKAEPLIETENYKALYAYRLEFHAILNEIRELKKQEDHRHAPHCTVKDREWLKRMLTQHLWEYCIKTYEYFYWQKRWFELTEKEKEARENYEKFKTNRRSEFVREAQDVEPIHDCDRETV